MRRLPVIAAIMLAAGVVGYARAVPPGFTLEFEGSGEPTVIFTGNVHSGTGMYCGDCHLQIFDVSRSAQITRADHNRNQYCFVCHNGETAFAARRNCTTCHLEEEEEL